MSDLDLVAALTRLETAVSALRARLRDRLGVSGADLTVLQYIARAEEAGRTVRVKDLAKHVGLTGPAVTGTIDRLEQGGYLSRVPNPADGRSRHIELTESTRRDYTSAMDRTDDHLHELMASFSERDRVRFVRIVDRIVAAVDLGAPNP
ncbi:MarR family winged helix-turn-helix transcriptional regulator [Curtobacterium sp. VKM Ac-1393]|uniref:MarR family winged helix-turn-helix transcriptional regulator n=1 Tax=Curtobacterium sp. VKM Ac-1393 TaxID=2783814 RepID=UPI00188C0D83|nr:MarR family transcriptional regulator [Curtobacterium sp. VKM Ac-1393]MBF4608988.1 MarR family transcriptional regulator [Curtobacterium sp. VKM Ac-1393]